MCKWVTQSQLWLFTPHSLHPVPRPTSSVQATFLWSTAIVRTTSIFCCPFGLSSHPGARTILLKMEPHLRRRHSPIHKGVCSSCGSLDPGVVWPLPTSPESLHTSSFPCILYTSFTAGPHPLHGPLFIYLCLSLDSYFLPALPINSCPSLSFIPYLITASSKSPFLTSPVGRPQSSHYLSFETLSTIVI